MTLDPSALITTVYAFFSAVRLFFYIPQMCAIARERTAAHAISLISWIFWALSHAATAVYGYAVTSDPLIGWMMFGNTLGCLSIVALTVSKRQRYGWVQTPVEQSQGLSCVCRRAQ